MELLNPLLWIILLTVCLLGYRLRCSMTQQGAEIFRQACLDNPFISVEEKHKRNRLQELLSILISSTNVDVSAEFQTDHLHREYVETSIYVRQIDLPLLGDVNLEAVSTALFGKPDQIPYHLWPTAADFFADMSPVFAEEAVYVYVTHNGVPSAAWLRSIYRKHLCSDTKLFAVCVTAIIALFLAVGFALFFDDHYYNAYPDLQKYIDLMGLLPEHALLQKGGVVFGAALAFFASICVYAAGFAVNRIICGSWGAAKSNSLFLLSVCSFISLYVFFCVDFGFVLRPQVAEAVLGQETKDLLERICDQIRKCYPQMVAVLALTTCGLDMCGFSIEGVRTVLLGVLILFGGMFIMYTSIANLWYVTAYAVAFILLLSAIAALRRYRSFRRGGS